MSAHHFAQQTIAAHLACCERMLEAVAAMTVQEKAQLEEWERRHAASNGEAGADAWPGWNAIINRISH